MFMVVCRLIGWVMLINFPVQTEEMGGQYYSYYHIIVTSVADYQGSLS